MCTCNVPSHNNISFIMLQTPIYDAITDARDNLAGALLFAGQYAIPEVQHLIPIIRISIYCTAKNNAVISSPTWLAVSINL